MTDFIDQIEAKSFPITYEVPSPRGGNVEEYIKKIESYGFLDQLSGLNVCNNPVGKVRIDPLPFSYLLKQRVSVEPIPHLTCRDATLSGLQKWLLGADSLNIKTILAMTGDFAVGDYPAEQKIDNINSLELITGIKKYLNEGQLMPELSARESRHRNRYLTEMESLERPTDFTVGGVLLPGRAKEAEYAAKKIEAGTDFFQTQITYDPKEILVVLDELEELTEHTPPVLVSTAPFSSPSEMQFLSDNVPQVKIPDKVQKRLSRAGDFARESVHYAVEMYGEIMSGAEERGLKTKIGAHIIPMMAEEMVPEIIEGLKDI